jgi:hypothetical protein
MWVGRIVTSGIFAAVLLSGCGHKASIAEEVEASPSITVSPVTIDSPLKELPNERIQRTLVKDDLVLAATQKGLFRGSLSKKQWEQVSFPTDPSTLTLFGDNPSSNLLTAILPRKGWDSKTQKAIQIKNPGLYLSRDQGKTWQLQSNAEEFLQVLQVGEKLFATVRRDPPSGSYDNGVVMVSEDQGKTWRDLTTPASRAWRILPDPDHPGLICLQVTGIRMYIYQADDENYKWKQYREWDWPSKPKQKVAPQVLWGRVELGHFPIYFSTLKNYFAHDFGDGIFLPGLTLSPRVAKYRFASNAPKKVDIDVKLTAQDDSIEFLDNKKNHDFWWVEVRQPSGEITRSEKYEGPLGEHYGSKPKRVQAAKEYRQSHPVSKTRLKTGSVYTRSLDLEDFIRQIEPGTYYVRVFYNSGWSMTKTNWDMKTDHEFCGEVASEEFQVQISR